MHQVHISSFCIFPFLFFSQGGGGSTDLIKISLLCCFGSSRRISFLRKEGHLLPTSLNNTDTAIIQELLIQSDWYHMIRHIFESVVQDGRTLKYAHINPFFLVYCNSTVSNCSKVSLKLFDVSQLDTIFI